MEQTQPNFYPKTNYVNMAESKLKLLDLEKELINKEISSMQEEYVSKPVKDKPVFDNSLIQKILAKKEELKLNSSEKERIKENLEMKKDFEMKYYMENIRDLTKANQYLEEKLEKQDQQLTVKNGEKIVIQNEIENQKQEGERLENEERLIKERKETVIHELADIETTLQSKEKKVNELQGDCHVLENNKNGLLDRIRVLEDELSTKKIELAKVVEQLSNTENKLKINTLEKENLVDLRVDKNECYRLCTDKLKTINDEKLINHSRLENYKQDLILKEAEQTKLSSEKEYHLSMYSDFKNLKDVYVRKFDQLKDKRDEVMESLLKDRSSLANIERKASETILRSRKLFS